MVEILNLIESVSEGLSTHSTVNIVRRILVFCILFNHGLHMYQVKHNYIEWFQSYEAERISTVINTKVHYFVKIYLELQFLFSACCLTMTYICTTFRENILDGFRVIKRVHNLNTNNVNGALFN